MKLSSRRRYTAPADADHHLGGLASLGGRMTTTGLAPGRQDAPGCRCAGARADTLITVVAVRSSPLRFAAAKGEGLNCSPCTGATQVPGWCQATTSCSNPGAEKVTVAGTDLWRRCRAKRELNWAERFMSFRATTPGRWVVAPDVRQSLDMGTSGGRCIGSV